MYVYVDLCIVDVTIHALCTWLGELLTAIERVAVCTQSYCANPFRIADLLRREVGHGDRAGELGVAHLSQCLPLPLYIGGGGGRGVSGCRLGVAHLCQYLPLDTGGEGGRGCQGVRLKTRRGKGVGVSVAG